MVKISKKFKLTLSVLLLLSFATTLFNFSLYGKAYSSGSFKPYKVIVTAGRLNIRKYATTKSAIVGGYNKGTIVDVIGQSGSFLKTARGYIAAYYTKKYVTNQSTASRGSTSVTPYKVQVTAYRLNIRRSASTRAAIVGGYSRGTVVDVIGQSGSFLKTSKGYIASAYTKRYSSGTSTAPTTPAFTSYKVQVTAYRLNIRRSASTRAAIVGGYSRGTIVDVIGQSGSFLKTSKGYIASAYTKRYSSGTSTAPTTPAFTSYKVQVTAYRLNIRRSASTRAAIVGGYSRGTIVDVIGQSGSFLKTSKGYIASAYTKRYSSGTTPTTPVFKPYKVMVNTAWLNIRKGPSTSTALMGHYTRGAIVDVTGKSGAFLKVAKGYIAEAYTKVYAVPEEPSRGDSTQNVGKYIVVNESTPILLSINGTADGRYAVKGKKYKIASQTNDYYKIKVGRKYGYIHSSKASLLDKQYTGKIAIAWDYLYSRYSNASHYDDSNDIIRRSSFETGYDVVSPTWFYMTGDATNPSSIKVQDKADKGYVKAAHQNGYEVWALISEFNTERAYKIFYDNTVRQRVISQIVNLANTYDVDGVNIDFEGFGGIKANTAGFTVFVSELSKALKQYGHNVSVDVTKPVLYSVYSTCYDRPALAPHVDYMIYMAYDEHYAGCKTPGSVGSYPWIESGLKKMIEQGVPKEKIILGVPFYMRDFTISDIDVPCNSIVFERAGALYKTPVLTDSNRIADINPGYALRVLENGSNDWYMVEYNGINGYVSKKDVVFVPQDTSAASIDSSIDVILPYDAIALKNDSKLYSQPSESEAFNLAQEKIGHAFKHIDTIDGWYKVSYKGKEAYISQKDGVYVYGNGKNNTEEVLPDIILDYASVVVKSQTIIRKNASENNDNILVNTSEGDSFEYVGAAPGDSNWYIVKYNGVQAYALKEDTFFVSGSTKKSSVVKSTAVSMKTVQEKKKLSNSRVYYDAASRQNVLEYYSAGYRHLVWIEDELSMGWRMDIIRSYNLPGMAAWNLNWYPSQGVVDVIKGKLK